MSTMRILTAAAFATVFAVSTASAQQAQRVAGTIDKVEGNTLYIKSANGPVSLTLADNALIVAQWLAGHAKVAWVSYPGLPGDRYHNLAQKYCPKGAGAVFTFGLKGGYDAGVKLVSNVKLLSHLANIGDTRSLIIHPASTTHRQLSDTQKVQAGAGPDVVRLSIGIEDKDDIIADLEQALAG